MSRIVRRSQSFRSVGLMLGALALSLKPVQGDAAQLDAWRAAFPNQVAQCWNIGTHAAWVQTSVTVAFEMTAQGVPVPETIRAIHDNGGPDLTHAFAAARRAIIRCARGGYDLPTEAYDAWRNVQITFEPTEMSLR